MQEDVIIISSDEENEDNRLNSNDQHQFNNVQNQACEKRHSNLTRDMMNNMENYLIVQYLDLTFTNQSFQRFLVEECGLEEVCKVKILYNKSINPRMCCVQFAYPVVSDQSDLIPDDSLCLEKVISVITQKSQNKQLCCRQLRDCDIELFMRKKRKKSSSMRGNRLLPSLIHLLKDRNMNPLEHVFIIDFELAVLSRDEYIPLEMSVIKYSLLTSEIDTNKFHTLINPGDIPEYLLKTEEYTRKYIHGISSDMGQSDYIKIWDDFLKFASISTTEQARNCVLIAKDPNAENGCFRWFMQRTNTQKSRSFEDLDQEFVAFQFLFDHVEDFDVIIDWNQFLQYYQPELTTSQIEVANKRVLDQLDSRDKCTFHQDAPMLYHCALEDCCAIAHVLTKCLKSQWQFLNEPVPEESGRGLHRLLARQNMNSNLPGMEMERVASPELSEEVYEEWQIPDDQSMFFDP